MKKLIVGTVMMCLLAGVMFLQGCALFVVGAAAGAAVGTVSVIKNELRTMQEVKLDRAWDAANDAMEDLKFAVITGDTRKDAAVGELHGRNTEDQPLTILLTRKNDKLTEISIRVGTFDTAANRASAQLVYDTMKKHF